VYENRVLRRLFGPRMDEVTGCSRKLRNEQLHNFCLQPSIIKTIKTWEKEIDKVKACSTNREEEEEENTHRVLV
jgi:hypothetical protein